MKFKKGIVQLILMSLLITMVSCRGGDKAKGHHQEGLIPIEHQPASVEHQAYDTSTMHILHNSLANNFTHKDFIILDQPYQPGESTKAELDQVVNAYLQVKDALVNDDIAEADKAASVMSEKVTAVIPTKLEGKGLEAWQNHQALYLAKLDEMKHISGLEKKRSYFSHISEIMYCTIKSFGLKQGNLFVIFCPMAFDGKGAYWISGSKIIQNPYFGKKMPTCGEIKETI
jgi:hypothetical protein